MNYIGSKYKLSEFIKQGVYSVVGKDLSNKVFCDLFAGTGIVGRVFKKEVKQVISNDIEYYSYVLNKNYIENHKPLDFLSHIFELNYLKGIEGFIFEEYSENGRANRQYFKSENGKRIDAIRQKIESWKNNNEISNELYFFLLASLLESADKVANTASVYGAFLKHIKKSAQKDLHIEPAIFIENENEHLVFNKNANILIKEIEGDILYLDPPYNTREYGANYHLLNTIAKYDCFQPKGKTGLRDYQKSSFCKKNEVVQAFENLIKNAHFKYIFLSYNNEGLMPPDVVREIMKKYGRYDLFSTDYQRFRADKEENRNHKSDKTTEYLHILEK
ncbi:DNA adenine methylase [Capnocytophaga cynodegmi]|uniref:site-specific DNA-methyltransferase (adenine-specific) n=1 Tax=Capnocytophaga cynodegmi TaxID=28189 RepID=A0A0B7HLW8_9FLAO|nr:DNA adenine methylase [Capnocytophaga cynodegmi]ATA67976.1 modification methylase [Capnocytophaga cynodegmi]GIM54475.1 restriction endonuclease subunit M [Capnocytophaga cynodegmi]CEN37134.1 Modification methylase NlaIII [Capnocytophaga cynodegmi]CEN40721.1 Modification methylase NlaIII [Capnocytophaga cynodegmi]